MIKLFTFAHKRPDFLEMQLKSFKKNLEDEFEFIVFNNAHFDPKKNHYNEIRDYCAANNLQCIDVQKDQNLINKLHSYDGENLFNSDGQYGNASIACAYPLCWAWEHYISKMNDQICIIDSDMFLVEKVNISKQLENYDIIFMPQSRGNGVHYMWNGISFMNLNNMPNKASLNWWCGFVEGQPVDVGGRTYYYLEEYKDKLRLLELKQDYIGEDPSCDFSPANYEYFRFDETKILWHHRGGSGWDGKSKDYLNKKTMWMKNKFGL